MSEDNFMLPKPGELLGPFFNELNLPQGVPGVIEDSNGIWLKSRHGRGGRWHMGWLATCQRCGAQWGIRGKRYSWDKQKMPTRCPGCMSRQWMKKPEEDGNSAGSPTIARHVGEAYRPQEYEDRALAQGEEQLEEDPRVQDMMASGKYDPKLKLVYHSTSSPPVCSVCGVDVQDQVFITSGTGVVYCLDHAPHLQEAA